jgi:hypothetical protein
MKSIYLREMPDLVSSSSDEEQNPDGFDLEVDYSHLLQVQKSARSGIMLGGGIHDSEQPLVSSADADPQNTDPRAALELEKALARSRKKKPKNPENKLKNEKRRQSKSQFDERFLI